LRVRDESRVSSEELAAVDEGRSAIAGRAKKENIATPFSHEQVDLTTVNPQGVVTPVAAVETSSPVASAAPAQLPTPVHALYQNLMEEMTTIQTGDKTESTITLGSKAGIFEGAQVVLTSFESSKGQFNITIANLTQHAQQVMQGAQAGLVTALGEKGYFVHIFLPTTVELRNPIVTASAQEGREQQQQGQPGQQRQQPQGDSKNRGRNWA
jgi:hypothetical protein